MCAGGRGHLCSRSVSHTLPSCRYLPGACCWAHHIGTVTTTSYTTEAKLGTMSNRQWMAVLSDPMPHKVVLSTCHQKKPCLYLAVSIRIVLILTGLSPRDELETVAKHAVKWTKHIMYHASDGPASQVCLPLICCELSVMSQYMSAVTIPPPSGLYSASTVHVTLLGLS